MKSSSAFSGWEMAQGFSAVQSVNAKATLYWQGSQPQSVIFIETGWVKLVRVEENGRQRITALHPPGSLLGVAESVAELNHPETAVALCSCRLHSITAPAFLNLVTTDLRLSAQIARALSRWSYVRDICSTQTGSVSPQLRLQQLMWQLLRVQSRDGETGNGQREGTRLLAPVEYQELAQMLGVSPEHFSRMLGSLEKEDILRRDKGWLVFFNLKWLWRAPEVEDVIKPDQCRPSQFMRADPVCA
ncbi:MAG: hypothetical protein JMDDDDMK_05712 [Acidobacteria bacterium]|nr:hypothetical protein [Acidobacteriota bacterium]